MKSMSLKAKIVSGVITGGMILSSVSAFAATTKQQNTDTSKASQQVQINTKKQMNLDMKLKKLVTDKTITQAQADKIKAATIAKKAAHKAEREKIKNMTDAQRKIYMESNKDKHVNILKSLVSSGIITQAQADKIGPGILGGPGENGRHMKPQVELETNLKKLVTDKTITQAQADKVKATTVKQQAAHKAEREKIKNMTEAQRKIYMESNKDKHVNILKLLVDDGTITQAQADKIGLGGGKHDGGRGYMKGLKIK